MFIQCSQIGAITELTKEISTDKVIPDRVVVGEISCEKGENAEEGNRKKEG